MINLPISILDLAVVNHESSPAQAIEYSMKVAVQADTLGYKRLWFAEHHNTPGIASSATVLLIQKAASLTHNIRVGSGGIMLPNHSPLVVAEQFGTLETLYPGRIDLGLGRAPGTDQITAYALRRDHYQNAMNFPNEVRELQNYFQPSNSEAKVNAYPGKGLKIPIWILGSSTSSARLAAELGLPYAFATHFAPAQFFDAIKIYRDLFKPSEQLEKPYIISCVNGIAADTDEEAQFLSSSFYNMVTNLVTNRYKTGLLPAGKLDSAIHNPAIRQAVEAFGACTFIGGPKTIESQLKEFIDDSKVDELMFTGYIYDIEARLKSFRIISELFTTED